MKGALGSQMSGSMRKAHALELFSGLSSRYGLMAALLSFGQDPRWRRTMVAAVRVKPAGGQSSGAGGEADRDDRREQQRRL